MQEQSCEFSPIEQSIRQIRETNFLFSDMLRSAATPTTGTAAQTNPQNSAANAAAAAAAAAAFQSYNSPSAQYSLSPLGGFGTAFTSNPGYASSSFAAASFNVLNNIQQQQHHQQQQHQSNMVTTPQALLQQQQQQQQHLQLNDLIGNNSPKEDQQSNVFPKKYSIDLQAQQSSHYSSFPMGLPMIPLNQPYSQLAKDGSSSHRGSILTPIQANSIFDDQNGNASGLLSRPLQLLDQKDSTITESQQPLDNNGWQSYPHHGFSRKISGNALFTGSSKSQQQNSNNNPSQFMSYEQNYTFSSALRKPSGIQSIYFDSPRQFGSFYPYASPIGMSNNSTNNNNPTGSSFSQFISNNAQILQQQGSSAINATGDPNATTTNTAVVNSASTAPLKQPIFFPEQDDGSPLQFNKAPQTPSSPISPAGTLTPLNIGNALNNSNATSGFQSQPLITTAQKSGRNILELHRQNILLQQYHQQKESLQQQQMQLTEQALQASKLDQQLANNSNINNNNNGGGGGSGNSNINQINPQQPNIVLSEPMHHHLNKPQEQQQQQHQQQQQQPQHYPQQTPFLQQFSHYQQPHAQQQPPYMYFGHQQPNMITGQYMPNSAQTMFPTGGYFNLRVPGENQQPNSATTTNNLLGQTAPQQWENVLSTKNVATAAAAVVAASSTNGILNADDSHQNMFKFKMPHISDRHAAESDRVQSVQQLTERVNNLTVGNANLKDSCDDSAQIEQEEDDDDDDDDDEEEDDFGEYSSKRTGGGDSRVSLKMKRNPAKGLKESKGISRSMHSLQSSSQMIGSSHGIASSSSKPSRKQVNETKNIPKNYSKAIIGYIQKHPDACQRLLGDEYTFDQFEQFLMERKEKLTAIKDLRSLWSKTNCEDARHETFNRVFRIFSFKFFRENAVAYIYSSKKIRNTRALITYRFILQRALHDPESFSFMKFQS